MIGRWWSDPRVRSVLQVVLGGVWLGALVGSSLADGVPIDREQVLLWLMSGLAIWSIGSSRSTAWRAVADWLPFGLVLLIYDYSRGAADGLGRPVAFTPQIDADRWIGLGEVPTVRLQRALIDPRHVAWWEVAIGLIYLSHFVVPFVVAAVLWLRDRRRWLGYATRFVVLSFAAVVIFVAFPAAPPWLAAREGFIDPVRRTVGRGLSEIGLDVATRLLDKGRATVNPVAAIPSLHAGYAFLVTLVLWPTANRWMRALLVAYPLAMGFALVVSGEHFVVDILIGWALVVAVHLGVGRAGRAINRRRSAPGSQLEYSSE